MQRQHVILQTNEHPARGIAANPAIGHLHSGKASIHVLAPTLSNRITQEHQGMLVLLNPLMPPATPLRPELAKPLVTPNWPCPGKALVRRWNFEAMVRLRRLRLGLALAGPCNRNEREEDQC